MPDAPAQAHERDRRVLLLAPAGNDAHAASLVLEEGGVATAACAGAPELSAELARGAAAVLITEEGLEAGGLAAVREWLLSQPRWSDLPVIVVADQGVADSPRAALVRELLPAGNVAVIERPCRTATLRSAVRAAVRARLRQYELRDTLERLGAAEAHARESAESLRLALEASDAAPWSCFAGDAMEWSPAFRTLLGFDADQAPSRAAWLARVHPSDRPRLAGRVEAGLRADAGERWREEYRVAHPAKGERWVVSFGRTAAARPGDPTRLTGISLDITERVRAEEALERYNELLAQTVSTVTAKLEASNQALRLSERMAALGTFAAGLGHDLSNLLMPLRTRVSLLLDRDDLPPDAREDVLAVARPADYLAMLTQGLRHFARDPEHGWESPCTDLAEWRNEVLGFLRTAVPKGAELRFAVCDGLPCVAVPPHALTQAVLNLVQNARDAITWERGNAPGGLIEVSCAAEPDALSVRITVRDNGPGMTDEVKRRCMEPFFTTKARQKGTGLGLAMVHGIATRAGGRVEVRSELGRGAEIALVLPAAQGRAADDQKPIAAVTVADSHAAQLVNIMLSTMGYEVRAQAPPHGGDGARSPETPPDGAQIWVADAARVSRSAAAEFVRGGPRRVVALNAGADWRGAGIVPLPPGSPLSAIRRALVTCGQPPPHGAPGSSAG